MFPSRVYWLVATLIRITGAWRWASLAVVASFSSGATAAADRPEREFIEAADPRLRFSDGVHLLEGESDGSVRFDRVLDSRERGLRWDSPGARMRWRTDSRAVSVRLRFAERHSVGSRNSVGFYRIDGDAGSGSSFTRPSVPESELVLDLVVAGDGKYHDYEVILPYADSVEFLGVEVDERSHWQEPSPRPQTRWLAFGDSVTHGFTASDVTRSYAFLVAELNSWELLNLGIAGRGTHGPDGAFLAGIEADVISILIGVNDWQGGADIESFRRNYKTLLSDLRERRPMVPIFAITPLWVPPSWAPPSANRSLEEYREVIREIVGEFRELRIALVEGPSLIDHDPGLFDAIAVHPNDEGFAQMGERLAKQLNVADFR